MPGWGHRGLGPPGPVSVELRFVPSLVGSAMGGLADRGQPQLEGPTGLTSCLGCHVRAGSLKPHLLPVSGPPGASGPLSPFLRL